MINIKKLIDLVKAPIFLLIVNKKEISLINGTKKDITQEYQNKSQQIKRKFYPKKHSNFNHIIIKQKKKIRFQKISKKIIFSSIFKSFLYSFSL